MTASGTELLILFDPEKCTQCYGCQNACKSWRKLPYGVQNRRVVNLWDGHYPRVTCSSLSLACLHCVAPACEEACPVEAIAKRTDNGLVEVDAELCIGCRACLEACPYDVPQFGKDHMSKCDLCTTLTLASTTPPCVATCPNQALTLTRISTAEKRLHQENTLKLLNPRNVL